MLGQLDARQAQQVVDQAVHPLRLFRHDAEKPGLRRRVVRRRAAQGVDKPDQAGERRTQLVAGVGDEVGAHALHRAFPSAVGKHGDDTAAVRKRRVERHHRRVHLPRHGNRQAQLGCLVLALAQRPVDGGAEARVAQHGRHLLAESGLGRRVGALHPPVGTEHNQWVRQALHDHLLRPQQALDLRRPHRERPRQPLRFPRELGRGGEEGAGRRIARLRRAGPMQHCHRVAEVTRPKLCQPDRPGKHHHRRAKPGAPSEISQRYQPQQHCQRHRGPHRGDPEGHRTHAAPGGAAR